MRILPAIASSGNACKEECKYLECLLKDILKKYVDPELQPDTSEEAIVLSLREKNREIINVGDGSVAITIMCPTLEALDDLWQMYASDKLCRMFINAFIPGELRASVTLSVSVDEAAVQRSRQQLMSQGESLC